MGFEQALAGVGRVIAFVVALGLLSTLSWIVYGVYLLG